MIKFLIWFHDHVMGHEYKPTKYEFRAGGIGFDSYISICGKYKIEVWEPYEFLGSGGKMLVGQRRNYENQKYCWFMRLIWKIEFSKRKNLGKKFYIHTKK